MELRGFCVPAGSHDQPAHLDEPADPVRRDGEAVPQAAQEQLRLRGRGELEAARRHAVQRRVARSRHMEHADGRDDGDGRRQRHRHRGLPRYASDQRAGHPDYGDGRVGPRRRGQPRRHPCLGEGGQLPHQGRERQPRAAPDVRGAPLGLVQGRRLCEVRRRAGGADEADPHRGRQEPQLSVPSAAQRGMDGDVWRRRADPGRQAAAAAAGRCRARAGRHAAQRPRRPRAGDHRGAERLGAGGGRHRAALPALGRHYELRAAYRIRSG